MSQQLDTGSIKRKQQNAPTKLSSVANCFATAGVPDGKSNERKIPEQNVVTINQQQNAPQKQNTVNYTDVSSPTPLPTPPRNYPQVNLSAATQAARQIKTRTKESITKPAFYYEENGTQRQYMDDGHGSS